MVERAKYTERALIAVGLAASLGLAACGSSTEAVPTTTGPQETTSTTEAVNYRIDQRYDEGVLETRLVLNKDNVIISRAISACQGPDLATMYLDTSMEGVGGDRISPHIACADDGFLSENEIEGLLITPPPTEPALR